MNKEIVSRKIFLKNIVMGLTAASFLPEILLAKEITNENYTMANNNSYTLKNVLLETGFKYDNQHITSTETALYTIDIADGKIANIYRNQPEKDCIDAKGLLMLPSFRDMHIHLDKTIYADKWQAVNRKGGGIKGMIALEQQIIPELLKNSTYKAEKLIELLQANGSSFARSHVNIEPTSKLDSLKHLERALEHKKDSFDAELVIFPQHGLYYTDSLPYMKEAAKMNIDFIGGLDPTSVDGALEKTMDTTIQLALDNNKGIDIHLHETGESGLKTIEYLIAKVNENPTLKGKTFVSHSFVLGKLDNYQLENIAIQLANAQIGIISTVPIGKLIMPIPTLMNHGVHVMTGNDSIVDHWNTMGTGSVLQKANLAAQLYNQVSEFELSRLLKLATAGPIPLDDLGNQQWPKIGDKADIVLIDASCSAEAVSRISPIRSLIHQGNIIY
ncbi:amidohydrolase [Sphingobacterium rhinopitheci]|uniref:amidohydrolase n=1 Tax=Sphingobacterium rhinopitheci TaxID=2781960 RepID=UPI001F51E521|nr:amidohydrolase [Sphingobacterium rhinopitheci]